MRIETLGKAQPEHRDGSIQRCTGVDTVGAVDTVTLQLRGIQSKFSQSVGTWVLISFASFPNNEGHQTSLQRKMT